MAPAAPAYRYPERAPQRAPQKTTPVRVVPGQGKPTTVDALPSSVIMIAKIFAVFFIVFALLGFVRIGLASATVTTAVATEEVASKIESERSAGNELEVRESYLSNPTNLKAEATKLKMGAASETGILTLSKDVVVTDSAGNLSLIGSLRAASQA